MYSDFIKWNSRSGAAFFFNGKEEESEQFVVVRLSKKEWKRLGYLKVSENTHNCGVFLTNL